MSFPSTFPLLAGEKVLRNRFPFKQTQAKKPISKKENVHPFIVAKGLEQEVLFMEMYPVRLNNQELNGMGLVFYFNLCT